MGSSLNNLVLQAVSRNPEVERWYQTNKNTSLSSLISEGDKKRRIDEMHENSYIIQTEIYVLPKFSVECKKKKNVFLVQQINHFLDSLNIESDSSRYEVTTIHAMMMDQNFNKDDRNMMLGSKRFEQEVGEAEITTVYSGEVKNIIETLNLPEKVNIKVFHDIMVHPVPFRDYYDKIITGKERYRAI